MREGLIPDTVPADSLDVDLLRQWIGRREIRDDMVAAAAVSGLAATLDRADPVAGGEPLPPLWHWIFFRPEAKQSELGIDGHPVRGGLLPPIPLPRRMWAGGRLRFHRALEVGEDIRRETVVDNLTVKEGRQGALVFVTLTHRIEGLRGLAIEEQQDLVFRAPSRTTLSPAPAERATSDWREEKLPDVTLLFRYSALTFNAHRIHYDLPYARDEEGYPALVVQGPLTATLLVEQASRWSVKRPETFSFRGVGPLFADRPLSLCGRAAPDGMTLWAEDDEGRTAMTAQATFDVTAR